MVVYVVQSANMEIEFTTSQAAQDYASAHELGAPTERTKIIPDLVQANVTAGLTKDESDQVLNELNDVLIKVESNELADAVTLLESKSPSGSLTQGLIDDWTTIIEGYI